MENRFSGWKSLLLHENRKSQISREGSNIFQQIVFPESTIKCRYSVDFFWAKQNRGDTRGYRL